MTFTELIAIYQICLSFVGLDFINGGLVNVKNVQGHAKRGTIGVEIVKNARYAGRVVTKATNGLDANARYVGGVVTKATNGLDADAEYVARLATKSMIGQRTAKSVHDAANGMKQNINGMNANVRPVEKLVMKGISGKTDAHAPSAAPFVMKCTSGTVTHAPSVVKLVLKRINGFSLRLLNTKSLL
jgi:hypothetical protein